MEYTITKIKMLLILYSSNTTKVTKTTNMEQIQVYISSDIMSN